MRPIDLDTPLLKISAGDQWTIRDALMHKLVLGTTGSGKSSSTMKYTTLALLKAGFGCLFCIAKPEDAVSIKALCRQAGRMESVIEITATAGAFAFLAWELSRTGNINNVIDLLDHAIDMVRNSGPAQGQLGDEFWSSSKTAMLRATLPVVYAATGTVRIEDVLAFVRSAPNTPDQMKDPDWQSRSAFFAFFEQAAQRLEAGPIPGFDDDAAMRAIGYWREMAALDAKTLGNIKVTLTTALSRFAQGLLRNMFCGEVSVVPELIFHGAVILLNFPVQVYGEDGAVGQKLWKFCVQRACLARNALDPRQSKTPVAIIADECQNFLAPQDAEFMAQCRSSLVACVFATQSIPTIRAKVSAENAHDRAEHLISAFNTVVLHSSACPVTNEWFSRKIGKTLQRRSNYSEAHGSSTNYGGSMNTGNNWGSSSQYGGGTSSGNGSNSSSSSWSQGTSSGGSDGLGRTKGTGASHNLSRGHAEQMDFMIEAGDFGRMLKTGGPANRNRVSAIWFQAGRQFAATRTNVLLAEYQQ